MWGSPSNSLSLLSSGEGTDSWGGSRELTHVDTQRSHTIFNTYYVPSPKTKTQRHTSREERTMYTHYTCYIKTQAEVQKHLHIRLVLGRDEFWEEKEEEKGIEGAQKRKEIFKNTKTWM